MLKGIKIQFKIIVLMMLLLVSAVVLEVVWSSWAQTRQAEREMLEKTQILDQEMRAVWDFIDINQNRIDTDADGSFNFKNIYCAVAGKSVAKLFMRGNDYEIRYVSETPRFSKAYPDTFEDEAIKQFQADPDGGEYYGITTYEEQDVFRYVSPIYIKESCLSCHGDPAGEVDVTGHEKEGLKVGDLAGAASIIMPIDLYMEGIRANIFQQSIYFFVVLSTLIIIAYFAISYLVRRLERANAQLIEESQYKSDFLAIMSHEFRTPLTSILAFSDIYERTGKNLSDRDRDAIQEVKENGNTLLAMVNNILEVARADAGKVEMNYELVDLVDLISTVEGVIRPLAERRDIEFTTTIDADVPLIMADWEKLRRIIENLASNAVKFTQRGGKVWIDVHREEGSSTGYVAIEVNDTGIGIREEDLERVFEKFVQLDKSAYRRYNGSGLGLAVARELTEAHGGSIDVKSQAKHGSRFIIHIPIVTNERIMV
jgi:signal transduction histidine kinase